MSSSFYKAKSYLKGILIFDDELAVSKYFFIQFSIFLEGDF
jgi:hypothetical protein